MIPIYQLHIPKTGGTSVSEHIRSLLPPYMSLGSMSFPDLRKESPTGRLQDFPHLSFLDGKLFVSGHFGRGIIPKFSVPPRVITMLRHPIPRATSQYLHIRADPVANGFLPASKANSNISLERMLSDERRFFFSDRMCRHLGSIPDFDRLLATPTAPDTCFELAREFQDVSETEARRFLLDDVMVFGIQEFFQESLLLILGYLGLPLVQNTIRRQETQKLNLANAAKINRMLVDLNAKDLSLYGMAVSAFWFRFSSYASFILDEYISSSDAEKYRSDICARIYRLDNLLTLPSVRGKIG